MVPRKPRVYTADQWGIALENLPVSVLKIFRVLERANFLVYLVGGCVRDLLLGVLPKDFDFVTSARPEQVRAIFRPNAWIIGRRFRLVHVRMGNTIFQIVTFRSGQNDQNTLITRDNEWGSPEEDVSKRDLTINSLLYNPIDNQIFDYLGGMKDLQQKKLNMIGDPETRFLQDPVRMIRILKFQARFPSFTIPLNTRKIIKTLAQEIHKSAPERVVEEFFKGLESSYSSAFFDLLARYEVLRNIFPIWDKYFRKNKSAVTKALLSSDNFAKQFPEKKIPRSVLLANLVIPCTSKKCMKNECWESILEHLFSGKCSIPQKTKHTAIQSLRFYQTITTTSSFQETNFFPDEEQSAFGMQLLALQAMNDKKLLPLLDDWQNLY